MLLINNIIWGVHNKTLSYDLIPVEAYLFSLCHSLGNSLQFICFSFFLLCTFLVSYCNFNKLPQNLVTENNWIYYFTVLDVRLKSRCQQGCVSSGDSKQESICLLLKVPEWLGPPPSSHSKCMISISVFPSPFPDFIPLAFLFRNLSNYIGSTQIIQNHLLI